MNRRLSLWLPAILLLAVLFAFGLTTPVHAQDVETPTETPAVTGEAAAPHAEVPVGDEAPAVEVVADAPVEEPATDLAATVEALADAGAVLTDASGEVLSLTSPLAQDALTGSDPYFMVGGVYYGFTSGISCPAIVLPANCTTGVATPIQAAITNFAVRHATGVITVEAGTYNEIVTINGVTGLTGLIGAGSSNTTGSVLNGGIEVLNMTTGFTLRGFYILDDYAGPTVNFHNNSGTLNIEDLEIQNVNQDGIGLQVTNQTGAVNLYAVNSYNNGAEGANLTVTGAVTITNSAFDANGSDAGESNGLNVTATGAVNLNGVSASNNTRGSGAEITSQTSVTVKNSSFLLNQQTIADTNGSGTYIHSGKGAVLLENIVASDNQFMGIMIENPIGAVTLRNIRAGGNGASGVYVDTNTGGNGTGNVTLSDFSVDFNGRAGVEIYAMGTVNANNIYSSDNADGVGLYIANNFGTIAKTVTVTNGIFLHNHNADPDNLILGNGLRINSLGAVTLNHIVANDNGANGIYVRTEWGTGAGISVLSTLGANEAHGNGYRGMWLWASGPVVVNNYSSWGSESVGLYIDNTKGTGTVTLTNVTVHHAVQNLEDNDAIVIFSKGAVTLNNVDSSENDTGGTAVINIDAATAQNVTVNGGTFSDNHDLLHLGWAGLFINSKGVVAVNNVRADNNGSGVWVVTRGNITLNNVQASGNTYDDGIHLDNTAGTGTVSVTIPTTAWEDNSGNVGDGLEILTTGTATVSNFYTNSNGGNGIYIDNRYATTPKAVTVNSARWINDNGGSGLTVYSDGAITINGAYSYDNDTGEGIYLENITGTAGITLTDVGAYSNGGNGIYINTNGAVSLTKANGSSDNGANGLFINNNTGSGTVTVSAIYGASYDGNGGTGVFVLTRGAVTLTNISASDNGYGGLAAIIFPGALSSTTAGVTVNNPTWNYDSSRFDHNSLSGVFVSTQGGPIALNNLRTASGNGLWGAYLEVLGTRLGAVTVTSRTWDGHGFNSNDADGLYIETLGAINLTGVRANDNTGAYDVDPLVDDYPFGNGITLDNQTQTGAVTLKDIQATGNAGMGLHVLTSGTISLSGGWISSNGETGAYLNNSYAATAKTVTISNAGFDGNGVQGLNVVTRGAITLTKSGANDNHNGSGMLLDNTAATLPAAISVTGAYGNNNAQGLKVLPHGAVTVKDSSFNGNPQSGVFIDCDDYPAPVTITNVTANDSQDVVTYGTGVVILNTNSPILITNLRADNNGYHGLAVFTYGAPVTINNSFFNDNVRDGLNISAFGPIIINTIEANNNHHNGAILDNHWMVGTSATITVNKSTFNGNGWDGLNAQSWRAVTLNGIIADFNGLYGTEIWTDATMPVTVLSTLRANEFNWNGQAGLYIGRANAVTGSKITAIGNANEGINIITSGVVNLTTGTVRSNGKTGMMIDANAAITLTGFSVMDNGRGGEPGDRDGIWVISHGANVTIVNSNITGNGRRGIYGQMSGGTLTLRGTFWLGNNASGGVYNPNLEFDGSGHMLVIVR